MKHAAAMKYGGELVAAEDCTYDSFKELVPLCPNCKEPVFLRIGGDRLSVKGNEYMVGPHWCHFKGVSAEQIAGCEARVSGYTESDRQRIAAKARGQRLKLLQRWFWSVFLSRHEFKYPGDVNLDPSHYSSGEMKLCSTAGWTLEQMLKTPAEDGEEMITVEYEGLIGFDAEVKTELDFIVLDVVAQKLANNKWNGGTDEDTFSVDLSEYDDPFLIDHSFRAKIKSHLKYITEVLSFLVARSSRHTLLLPILHDSVKHFIWCHADIHHNGQEFRMTDDVANYARFSVVANLVAFIYSIDWAAEFQRLEAESKQRKDAA